MGSLDQLDYSYPSAGELLAAGAVLPALGILAVAARFAARAKQKTYIGKDDVTILVALVFVMSMGVLLIYGNTKGAFGYPASSLSSVDAVSSRDEIQPNFLTFQLGFWFWIPAILGLGFIRLSVLFFYRRVFIANCGSAFDILSKILLYVVGVWTVLYLFLMVFYCGLNFPNQNAPAGGYSSQCLNGLELCLSFAVTDPALDLAIWILPMPTVSPSFLPSSCSLEFSLQRLITCL